MGNNSGWSKGALNSLQGGAVVHKLLDEVRNRNKHMLIVCGAGISMTGPSPAASGRLIGQAYENHLRNKGLDIPVDINGDIAKLYENFCYIGPNKEFSQEEHNQFIEAITDRSNEFYFSGIPNFQHKALINETEAAEGRLRVYSLNMDEFFEAANNLSSVSVVNAASLGDKDESDSIFRDWNILAAHGKNIKNEQSVWSHNVLSGGDSLSVSEYLDGEKKILEKSLLCLKKGPSYDYVIFVGIAAPLNYLINSIPSNLTRDFKWLWINPYDEPQDWLLEMGDSLFSIDNGDWVKASLTECLWNAQATFYERWFSNSCSMNVSEIPLVNKYAEERHKRNLVQSLYRARRIFDNGYISLAESQSNEEILNYYDVTKDIYQYPRKTSAHAYNDKFLGETLHKFYDKEIELDSSFNSSFPSLTIAGKSSNDSPISVHIFKVDGIVSDDKVAFGIAKTFDDKFVNPNNRHIIALDVAQNNQLPNLIKAIKEEFNQRFVKDDHFIDVVGRFNLDIYIKENNLSLPPIRGARP